MGIIHGENTIALKHGAADLVAIYHGVDLITSVSTLRDDATRLDQVDLGTDWTDLGPSTDPYLCSIHANTFRMYLDDAASVLTPKTDRQVFTAGTASADDGWIETVPASTGDAEGLITVLWRRATTTLTHGVGIKFEGAQVSILSRISDTEATRTAGADFQPGNIVRMTQTGDVHVLTVNGGAAQTWDDSGGLAGKGATYRSMALTMMGDRWNPSGASYVRRYSAALEYVEMT